MSQQVTIKAVGDPEPWQSQYGPMNAFTLTVDGLDKPVQVNRKPDSPALTEGQVIWLDQVGVHPRSPGHLKAKIVQPPDQQQSFQSRSNGTPNHDDATRRSIERQTCMRAAGDLYRGTGHDPAEVTKAADIFYGWVSQ